MIIEKHLPEDSDAPPSYDEISDPQLSALPGKPDSSTSQIEPSLTSTPLAGSSAPSRNAKKPPIHGKNSVRSSWWSFSRSRTAKEIRSTVLSLIRDVVKYQHPSASAGILDSCQEACQAHAISLSTILQEKYVEDRTPVYWAIVKRPLEPPNADEMDLVMTLLSLAAPLSPATISEIHLACLVTNNQPLFQELRLSRYLTSLSGTDDMLFGSTIPSDRVFIQDVQRDEAAFVAHLEIPHFQKRMRVSKFIILEFIAKGRMWGLKFSVSSPTADDQRFKAGSWLVTLSLLEHSPPTSVDSRLIIREPSIQPTDPPPQLIDAPIPSELQREPLRRKVTTKSKPTISLRMKSSGQLVPPYAKSDAPSEIVVSLQDSLMGSSLQYDGSSYIGVDGTLRAQLEARLALPEAECIIC